MKLFQLTPVRTCGAFLVLLVLCFSSNLIYAQTSEAYKLTVDSAASLDKDRYGNVIDLSAQPDLVPNLTVNATVANPLPIGFDFMMMGKVYTAFRPYGRGNLDLGVGTWSLNNAANALASASYANNPRIAPFWDELKSASSGATLRAITIGTAPRRVLVVEWRTLINSSSIGDSVYDGRFQARLYEEDNAIEFVYGKMAIGRGSAILSASVGLSMGVNDKQMVVIKDLNTFNTGYNLSDETTSRSLGNTYTAGNYITALNATSDSTCKRLTFLADTLVQPGNFRAFNVTQTEALLYWDDNSANELRFEVYRIDREKGTILDTTLSPGANFRTLINLLPGTTYTYKVLAYSEGRIAESRILDFTTLPPNNIVAVNSGNWSDTATWGGTVPTSLDSVTISKDLTVVVDVTNAVCHQLLVDSGATLMFDTLNSGRVLQVTYDVEVRATGRLVSTTYTGFTPASLTHSLYIGRNLRVDGLYDSYVKDAVTPTKASAIVNYFNKVGNAHLDGSGVFNLTTINLTKASVSDTLFFEPDSVLVRGANTDALSANGFFNTNMTGTAWIRGNYTLENRFFTVANWTLPASARLIIDNENLIIPGSGSVPTITGGELNMKAGKMTIGVTTTVYLNINTANSTIRMDGGTLNFGVGITSSAVTRLIMNGGTMRIGMMAPGYLRLTAAGSLLSLNGGDMIWVKGNADNSTTNTSLVLPATLDAASAMTGTNVQLGSAADTSSIANYLIQGNLPKVRIDTTGGSSKVVRVRLGDATYIRNGMEIGSNDTLQLNGKALELGTDSILNNGVIMPSANVSTDVVSIIHNEDVYLKGAGTFASSTLTVQTTDSLKRLVLENPATVNNLNLNQGSIKNAEKLTIGATPNTASLIQLGVAAANMQPMPLDSTPTFVSTLVSLVYNDMPNKMPYVAGKEFPAVPVLENLTIDRPSGLILPDTHITVNKQISLKRGAINLDRNYILTTNNWVSVAFVTVSPFTQSWLNARVSVKFPVGQASPVNYTLPLGHSKYEPLYLFDVTTNTSDTATALTYAADTLITFPVDSGFAYGDTGQYWMFGVERGYSAINTIKAGLDKPTTALSTVGVYASAVPFYTPSVAFKASGMRRSATQVATDNLVLDPANPYNFLVSGDFAVDTIYTDTFTIGSGQDFRNLTAVAEKLKRSYISGFPVFQITRFYDIAAVEAEVFPITFEKINYVNEVPTRVTIQMADNVISRKTSNTLVSLTASMPLILMDNVQNLTLDGTGKDANGTETGKREWNLTTLTNPNYNPVISIINDSRGVVLRGLDLVGNATGLTNSGTLLIGGSNKTRGNDSITVRECGIGSLNTSRSYNQVYSIGASASVRNDSNSFIDNDIYNFAANGMTIDGTGIGNGWNISGNSFYNNNTAANNIANTALNMVPNLGSSAHRIVGNYFGGQASKAEGGLLLLGNGNYTGMIITVDTFGTTLISNNIIRGITANVIVGMTLREGKWAIVNNTIGDTGAMGQLTFTSAAATNNVGIYLQASASKNARVLIEGNLIQNIFNNSTAVANKRLWGIWVNRANIPDLRIVNNTVRGLAISATPTTDFINPNLGGILVNSSIITGTIEGNTVEYLYNTGYGTIVGVAVASTSRFGQISRNTVRNLVGDSLTSASFGAQQRYVFGIMNYNGKWDINNNMVVLSQNRAHAVCMIGIRATNVADSTIMNNNTVILSGNVTANSRASYAMSFEPRKYGVIKNNVLVNLRRDAGVTTHPAMAFFHANMDYSLVYADHNLLYSAKGGAAAHWPSIWNNASYLTTSDTFFLNYKVLSNGIDNFLPSFVDTLSDGHLLATTANCKLDGVGAILPSVTEDFDEQLRTGQQPDLGADEIVLPLLAAPTFNGGNDTLCADLPRTLSVTNTAGVGTVKWFGTKDDITAVATGDVFTTDALPAGDTAFYAQVFDGDCKGERIEVKVTSLGKPVADVMLPALPYCKGSVATLIAQKSAGATLYWYSDSAATSLIASNDTLSFGPLNNDSTVYLVAVNGCQSAAMAIKVLVDTSSTIAEPVVSSPVTVCYNGAVDLNALAADSVYWFASLTDRNPVYVGASFPLQNLTVSQTYYAATKTGNCLSSRSQVDVVVAAPVSAVAADIAHEICAGGDIQLKAAAAGNVYWYATDTSTVEIVQDSVLSVTALNNDTSFYVAQNFNGCYGPLTKVSVKVIRVAEPVLVAAPVICYNTATALVVSRADSNDAVSWYSDAAATNLVGSGDTLVTPQLLNDTVFYAVSSYKGCVSNAVPCSITVVPVLADPSVPASTDVCYGTRFLAVESTGANVLWYADTTQAPLQNGNFFESDPLFTDTVFYALNVAGSCRSAFSRMEVNIIQQVQPAVTDTIVKVCQGERAYLTAVGTGNIRWFSTATGLTPVSTDSAWYTNPVFSNTNMFVENELGGCKSARRRVQIQVLSKPAVASVTAPAVVCYNESPGLQASGNGEKRWYTTAAASLPFSTDSVLVLKRLKQDTTVYVEIFNGQCTSERTPVFIRVLNIAAGAGLVLDDTVDVEAPINIPLTGAVNNQYNVSFGQGSSPSSASGMGPFNVTWNTVGLKTVRLTVSRTSGSVSCDTVITYNVYVRVPLGIADRPLSFNTAVYPVPAANLLNLHIEGSGDRDMEISLVNAVGMSVLEERVRCEGKLSKTLDVSGLARGLYILNVRSEGEVFTTKVILQ